VSKGETFLVLGGGGMIGVQIARQLIRRLEPKQLIIASLYQSEVDEVLAQLKSEAPTADLVGFSGDVFLRTDWNSQGLTRQQLLDSEEHRSALYTDLFSEFEAAYNQSQLVQLILKYRPDVVVDSINTATAISYQDVYTASVVAKNQFEALQRLGPGGSADLARQALDVLLLSQSVPQLVRHVLFIHRAMSEVGTRLEYPLHAFRG
jgi:pyrroline-5-carboxylate reductase